MKLCVLGLGYIGLPTAVMFARHGVQVHGVDVNKEVINLLSHHHVHIEEPGLAELLDEAMDAGMFKVSDQPEEADAFLIAVPTPFNLDKSPNLSYVENATKMILPYLQKGNLVILESTVPPKTVDNVMLPILQRTGFEMGKELFVSHSPERVLPGRLFEELVSNSRIVGGINKESSIKTAELYKTFVKGEIHLTDATTAEMVKLMENTYRDINIAYANELARIAETIGFNVWEAIDLANCHPRVNIHKPGPGVGGHCIAVDPWFIIKKAPQESQLITMSREINENTPYYVVSKVESIVAHKANPAIAIFGVAFKGNIDDLRESPSLTIINELVKKGYDLKVYDPHVTKNYLGKVETPENACQGSDCLVILTDHNEFCNYDYKKLTSLMRSRVVFDTRNILPSINFDKMGTEYILIGSKQTTELIHVGK